MALTFGGATSHRVNHGTLGNYAPTAVTVLQWIYPTTLTQNRILWSKGQSGTPFNRLVAQLRDTNTLRIMHTGSITTMIYLAAGNVLATNKWIFLAWTVDVGALNNQAHIYTGDLTTLATEVAYASRTDGIGFHDLSGEDCIIGNGASVDSSFEGRIAWTATIPSVLTLAQIQRLQWAPELAWNVFTPRHNTIYGYAGTGSQPDWSGSGHAGTVTGATVGDHVPLGPAFGQEEEEFDFWVESPEATFFDHFEGSSLDPRWTSVVSGAGAVTVTDSYVQLDASGATSDAAFIYYGTKLNRQRSQLWMFAFSQDDFDSPKILVLNKATAPVAEDFSTLNGRQILRVGSFSGSPDGVSFRYYDASGTAQDWNPSTNAWQTTGIGGLAPAVINDYYIIGIEFDASPGQSRWRMFGAHQTVASGYSVDQGLRIFMITDWVNWSDTRSQGDGLWLVIGDPATSHWASTQRCEWVRFGDGERQYLYTNAKNAVSGNYNIRTSWSYDRKFFVPRDRTTTDVSAVKDPWVVFDGSTYHMFYRTMTGSPAAQIRRATASSPLGAWTEQNTLASPPTDHSYHFPCVVYTPWEVSGREWQALIEDQDASVSPVSRTLRLLTASTPGGTWTDQGVVLSPGSGGSDDEQGPNVPVILHRNGQYEVWYSGSKPSGGVNFLFTTGMRATGPALDSLTKDGSGARVLNQDVVEAITADLNGSTISVASTTGFEVDQPVYLNQDSNADNWSGSRVRKIVTDTSIELYHRLMGFATANGAKVFGAHAGNQNVRDIVRVGNEWWIYTTTFNHAKLDGTFQSFQEESMLMILPAGTDLTQMAPSHYSWIDSPVVLRGSWSNIRSNENPTTIHGETAKSVGGFPLRARRYPLPAAIMAR